VRWNVVVAGVGAAGRPPPGSPGWPPHAPASWQGAWGSDRSSAPRRSAWRPDHTSGTPQTPWQSPSPSAARNSRSRCSDTRRWPHKPPGMRRSEASGPEACSMPAHPYRQGPTDESCRRRDAGPSGLLDGRCEPWPQDGDARLGRRPRKWRRAARPPPPDLGRWTTRAEDFGQRARFRLPVSREDPRFQGEARLRWLHKRPRPASRTKRGAGHGEGPVVGRR
jgi:hypothetical protein